MVDKLMVVQGVATRLWATEAAIDTAMAEASQLMQSILAAQAELRLSASATDASLAKTAEAISTLAAARQQTVAAHAELNELKLRLGVRTKLMGEQQKTSSSMPGDLRAVA